MNGSDGLGAIYPTDTIDVDARLATDGAILFRGFGIHDAASFEHFVDGHLREWMGYVDRASKRSAVAGRILTSTDTPPAFSIPLHCESSFTARWPQRIFFYCQTPATVGGRTPLADVRGVYRDLDPAVRERFDRDGVMYYRNFGTGVGMSWRDVFQVRDQAELERYCTAEAIGFEWVDAEHLRTAQVRPAALTHPGTGDRVWFNHALALHITALDATLRETLLRQRGEAGLPHNTYFGDGEPIPDAVIEHVRDVHERNQILFDWRAGDVLMLDNMRIAHGREPYSGTRAVHAAMGDPLTWREIGANLRPPAAWPRLQPRLDESDSALEPTQAATKHSLTAWFADAIARELVLDQFDIAMSFMDLGGDSMSGVMIIDGLMDDFGIDLSLDRLLGPESLDEIIRTLES